MNENLNKETTIFHGQKGGILIAIFICVICFTWVLLLKDSGYPLSSLDFPEKLYLILAIFISILGALRKIILFILNKKSYIELQNDHIIINRFVHYPLPGMETIYLEYKEIETVKIFPKKWGCDVIFIKKDQFGGDKIKFSGLDNGDFGSNDDERLDEELKKRGISSKILLR